MCLGAVRRGRPAVLLGAILAQGMGCADAGDTTLLTAAPALPAVVGRQQLPIIGGVLAPHPQLDHTGALVYRVRSSGVLGPLCTASLIGSQTVVTAKHCISVLPIFERIGIDVLWAQGPDFTNAIALHPVVAVASAPDDCGAGEAGAPLGCGPGLSGYGRDVAVAHLDDSVSGVTPIAVRPFSPSLLGASMVTLGYGISSAGGLVDGLRHIGRETVSSVEGNAYEALFGGFESFVEFVATGAITDADVFPRLEADPSLVDVAALQLEYDAALLLPGDEIITGKGPGDTQSCELDSGGPLARVRADGRWETFAVVSAGPRLARPFCAFGQIFASFGASTFAFLEAERSWEDPCGDVDATGRCDAGVLRRCETSFASGVRQIVEARCD